MLIPGRILDSCNRNVLLCRPPEGPTSVRICLQEVVAEVPAEKAAVLVAHWTEQDATKKAHSDVDDGGGG